jgi:CubicO group peptidase (beta-lactamase class C family)
MEPGTRWSYNNGGYVPLGAAIERITGKSLDEVLRKHILEPVGVNDTMLAPLGQRLRGALALDSLTL